MVKPEILGEAGSAFWDVVVSRIGADIDEIDYGALRMACVWLDWFEDARTSEDGNAYIRMGIATDKFLAISQRFGFTPKDRDQQQRVGKAIKQPKPKKTSLDSLSPKQLGLKQLHEEI